MPYEERYIQFNLPEIQQALSIGCVREEKESLPKGELTELKINEENPEQQNVIFLEFKNDKNEKTQIEFERKFFGLSLVFYCQGSGIPIPSRSQKILTIKPDHIIMSIKLERKPEDQNIE